MKFNETFFPVWLDQVRDKLLSLNIKGKDCRAYLFKSPLILDAKSWKAYFDDGLLPWQAVNEDLGLPWFETKQHRIL